MHHFLGRKTRPNSFGPTMRANKKEQVFELSLQFDSSNVSSD